jgi:hypothetical protein
MKSPCSAFSKTAKPEYPFARLFRCVSPKEFASVFGGEADQTIAFLLSFSRNQRYIGRVLKIIDDAKLTDAVSDYLKNVADQGVDPEFVKKIETCLESFIQGRNDLSSSKHLRKNIHIRVKKPVESSETDEPEDLRNKKSNTARERLPLPESLF